MSSCRYRSISSCRRRLRRSTLVRTPGLWARQSLTSDPRRWMFWLLVRLEVRAGAKWTVIIRVWRWMTCRMRWSRIITWDISRVGYVGLRGLRGLWRGCSWVTSNRAISFKCNRKLIWISTAATIYQKLVFCSTSKWSIFELSFTITARTKNKKYFHLSNFIY